MTIEQIGKLYFDGKHEMARKRVAKLKTAGFLAHRVKGVPTLPSAILLAEAGYRTLIDGGLIIDLPQTTWTRAQKRIQVSDATLTHELSVVDVKVAFTTAIEEVEDHRVSECSTWPALHRFDSVDSRGITVTVNPDGFMRIEKTCAAEVFESSYFIEVDLSRPH